MGSPSCCLMAETFPIPPPGSFTVSMCHLGQLPKWLSPGWHWLLDPKRNPQIANPGTFFLPGWSSQNPQVVWAAPLDKTEWEKKWCVRLGSDQEGGGEGGVPSGPPLFHMGKRARSAPFLWLPDTAALSIGPLLCIWLCSEIITLVKIKQIHFPHDLEPREGSGPFLPGLYLNYNVQQPFRSIKKTFWKTG